jgi:hypothetical protein
VIFLIIHSLISFFKVFLRHLSYDLFGLFVEKVKQSKYFNFWNILKYFFDQRKAYDFDPKIFINFYKSFIIKKRRTIEIYSTNFGSGFRCFFRRHFVFVLLKFYFLVFAVCVQYFAHYLSYYI